MKSVSSELGNRIRQYRLHVNLSQEKLALDAGLSVSFIGDIERGNKKPSVESLEKILRVMGITFIEFFDFETDIIPFKDCTALDKLVIFLRDRPNTDIEKIYSIIKQILDYDDNSEDS